LPARPNWVNIYLADISGNIMESGRELPGEVYTGLVDLPVEFPKEYSIVQNYPNPFNPTTTISYVVPKMEKINIRIYDVMGRKIETLINKEQSPGKYQIQWNAIDQSSGLYFCNIKAGKFEQTIKMMLVR